MKNIILLIALSAITLIANEIQVFNTNTMRINLDSNTKFEKVYMGKYSDFMENAQSILSTKEVILASASGALIGASMSQAASSDLAANAGAGAAGALVGYAIGSGFKWIINDNEYVYISLATNSKGESTLIQTLIVANSFLYDSTIEEMGIEARQSLLK